METNLTKSFLGKILEVQKKLPITMEKTEAGYNFKYTPLPDILALVKPLLIENGLVMFQSLIGSGMVGVKTTIAEVDGEGVFTDEILIDRLDTEMAKMAKIQGIGAVITYVRRYAIVTFFNLATEEDADSKNIKREKKVEAMRTITPEQVSQIQKIDKLKLLPKMLKDARINGVGEIPLNRFQKMVDYIETQNKKVG